MIPIYSRRVDRIPYTRGGRRMYKGGMILPGRSNLIGGYATLSDQEEEIDLRPDDDNGDDDD